MMRLIAVALPALLLVACSRAPAPAPAGGGNDPVAAECRAESRNSPAVREAWRAQIPSNQTLEDRMRAEINMAEANAFEDCMRRRGVRAGGGVERVRPPGWYW
jgi:hypothetical protein